MARKPMEYLANGRPAMELDRNAKKAAEKATRAWDVQAVHSVQQHTQQRAADAAVELSRSGFYAAVAGVCNAALAALVRLAYERDVDGLPANVDPATWRILIPAPWGREGHKRYGLRSTESTVLRKIMQDRQAGKRGHIRLFYFDDDTRRWFINLADYRTQEQAEEYLRRFPVESTAVRVAWRALNERRRSAE